MEQIAFDRTCVEPVKLLGDKIRYYRITSPIRFYTSSSQTRCFIERGYHVDTRLLPKVVKQLLRPTGKLGLVAVVYTKLLEHPYLFDEIQQTPIKISRQHCHVIVSSVVDQCETRGMKAGWLKLALWWGSVLSVTDDKGLPTNTTKLHLEQEWREDHPPQFRSI